MKDEEKNELQNWIQREVDTSSLYTVGFNELRTEDERDAYKKGISYATYKTMELMLNRVDSLVVTLKYTKQSAQEYKNDLETLSNILNKYKKHEE